MISDSNFSATAEKASAVVDGRTLPLRSVSTIELSHEQIGKITEKMMASLVHNTVDEQEPPALFSMNGVDVMPKKSINIITAQRKSGKSNFAGLLLAASASPEHQVLDGGLCSNYGCLSILYADTEQPERDIHRTIRRAMKTAGFGCDEQWEDHNIVVLALRDLSAYYEDGFTGTEEHLRELLILLAIKLYKPQLVIIDGLADLVPSINVETDSKNLMAWLDRIANAYDCAVVGMLHQNFGNSKIGGWAGTVADKKFTDCFTLCKDKNDKSSFTVSHEGRGETAPELNFRIIDPDGDGIGWIEPAAGNHPVANKKDKTAQQLRKLVNEAPLPCTYSDLVKWYKGEAKCSERTAKRHLATCRELGIIAECTTEDNKQLLCRPAATVSTPQQLQMPFPPQAC